MDEEPEEPLTYFLWTGSALRWIRSRFFPPYFYPGDRVFVARESEISFPLPTCFYEGLVYLHGARELGPEEIEILRAHTLLEAMYRKENG